MSPATAALSTIVRPAKIEDAEKLHQIIHGGYRTTDSWTTEHHLVSGERISVDAVVDTIESDIDRLFVACLEEGDPSEPVGCICVQFARDHAHLGLSDDHAMLGLFAVDPKHQSCGMGNKLLSYSLDHIKEVGSCKFATLWVIEQREDIIAWYERKGFKHTGKRVPFVAPDLALVKNMHFAVMEKAL